MTSQLQSSSSDLLINMPTTTPRNSSADTPSTRENLMALSTLLCRRRFSFMSSSFDIKLGSVSCRLFWSESIMNFDWGLFLQASCSVKFVYCWSLLYFVVNFLLTVEKEESYNKHKIMSEIFISYFTTQVTLRVANLANPTVDWLC